MKRNVALYIRDILQNMRPSLRLAVHADQNAEKDRALAGRPWEACSYVCAGADDGFSMARTREGGEILSFFRIAAAWGVGRVL